MGIGLENFMCYFFNYLESMKNSGWQKKNKNVGRWEGNASVHVAICISKLTQFRPG